ncbi:MAG: methylthioribose-phosphate isomerase [Verrucomicrobiota bacterium]
MQSPTLRAVNVLVRGRRRPFRTVSFDERSNEVRLINQRALPHRFEIVARSDYRATAESIRDMTVRGAGAIGATAAYGLAQGVRAFRGENLERFAIHVDRVYSSLRDARPTAVDPVNAMNAVCEAMTSETTVKTKQEIALDAARMFADDNVAHCQAIGDHGADLIRAGSTVLTHCNAGWLAFVDVGSATAPMYVAQSRGTPFTVYCDETRPRCQGASLTAWELGQQGIPHRVIADNAAGWLMQQGQIQLVIVGADRVLGRTGEIANKIGTYTKAVLAHRHGIPFYVAIPMSTLDWDLASGRDIPIEDRDGSEVLGAWGRVEDPRPRLRVGSSGTSSDLTYVRIANPGSTAINPGFDVTPPELITGIITPHGIFRPRDLGALRRRGS